MDNAKRRRRAPVKPPGAGDIISAALRFLARAAAWATALVLVDLAAPYTGVELAVNPLSVAVCAALGVPGFGAILCACAMF